MSEPITFETARLGMYLVDDIGQKCRVENISRSHSTIETRRYDNEGWWGDTAKWSSEMFDQRAWTRIPRGPAWGLGT